MTTLNLENVSAATFAVEENDRVLAERLSLKMVLDTIGVETHIEVSWAAAKLGARDAREWDDCEERSSALGWYETLLAEQFADIRESEWAAENDIREPIDEAFLDDCYMVFHECLNGVDVNRSLGNGTYETLEENVCMFFDEWEALDEATSRAVIKNILEGRRD